VRSGVDATTTKPPLHPPHRSPPEMTLTPKATAATDNRRVALETAYLSPPKHSDRTGVNERAADLIARFVGSMWMFYASIIGVAIWMAGLGVTVAGDHYPFNLMLLAVGSIMWLAMITILVAQNAQGELSDKQAEHRHQLGVTTHTLVAESTELTEAIHEQLIKMPSGVTSTTGHHRAEVKP
jgi:uncharacterized membrane protein